MTEAKLYVAMATALSLRSHVCVCLFLRAKFHIGKQECY